MNCLKDYIGLRDATLEEQVAPEGGIYINSLAGITSTMLSRIAEAEDKDGPSVWDNVQDVAGIRLFTDALVGLRKDYNLSYLLAGDEMTHTPDEDCNYEKVICNNRKLFATPWLYLLGVNICIEVLSTSVHIQHTTIDRQKYEELRNYYQAEYDKSLEQVIKMLCIESKKCMPCGGEIKHVVWLP